MERKYVLASGNRGKLREIAAMLEPLGITIRPQSDWQVPEAVEDAPTFIENALLKARNAARHTGLPCIADDSGLVVPYLRGEPGIYSARYAGEDADDRANVDRLLNELRACRATERRAYFYCAMVLLDAPDAPAPLVATARWHGEILHMPRGDGGFGYDPVFRVISSDETSGQKSVAELAMEEKSRVSHRGQALRELLRQLQAREN